MLFQIGPVTVDSPGPFNATDTSEEFGADYAVKAVVGARQPREFTGPADAKMTLSGTLFPDLFARAGHATGLHQIELLRSITNTGAPQILVRGDGKNLGWWLIEKVTQKSTKLAANGVGRVIAYDIALVKSSEAADPVSIISLLVSLFV